jgi:hypothetical protein
MEMANWSARRARQGLKPAFRPTTLCGKLGKSEGAIRLFKLPLAILVAFGTLSGGEAHARGAGTAHEHAWNPEHISGLPPEVRAGIARVCGPHAHAEHYFATFFDHAQRIKLHFEHAHCRDDQPMCNSSGCLHQEYLLTGSHYRLLRSYYGQGND